MKASLIAGLIIFGFNSVCFANSAEWRQNCALNAEAGTPLASYRAAAAALDADSRSLKLSEIQEKAAELLKKYGGFSKVKFTSVLPNKVAAETRMALFMAIQLENIMPVPKSGGWLSNGFINMSGTFVAGTPANKGLENTLRNQKIELVFDADYAGVDYHVEVNDNPEREITSQIMVGGSRILVDSAKLLRMMLYALNDEHLVINNERIDFNPACKNGE